ncbi:MAG: PadR family transcriptional regulator, regulatory protein PadR [Frankiaceae bacterium]|jgi:PadR family transcriptional regulator PadR|nr:PadR family transcriptional regulator, regulatory protein PadR [Frankiaceae bacterium]MDQ1633844.1 PadR family transcriptional regulator, regulatory protein PadR [Frankiaceae bacterium]
MPAAHDPQLLKGVLTLLLLRLLADRESYGYEVVQRLREVGLSGISEGSVYPALSRLEREGRISSRLVASSAGPARKYYQPTPAGRTALSSGTASWRSLSDLVDAVLAGPVPSTPTEGSTP